MPAATTKIAFDNTYARLPDRFFARQHPAVVPEPRLVRLNTDIATLLAIDADWLRSPDGVAFLAGNAVPDGADPIAQAYAGHQYAHFVPQLGDGRAILIGEIVGVDGKRRDVQWKGSGRTPFSRRGDGKSALGPVLREFVVSEAFAALGVPTTRALAAVATDERVARQEGYVRAGVFTRVAASHIRVGTFEYLRARNDADALRILADYVIARHYPGVAAAPQPYVALLEAVATAQADLIAQWMSIGFIHGVMNTDNTAVSGETIDFGPCAFMDVFHPRAVFSSIDRHGRYAWGSQPDIGIWNVTRFAETLLPLFANDSAEAVRIAEGALSIYPDRFRGQYEARFRAKLGLPPEAPDGLIQACLDLLTQQQVDFTLFFRQLTRVAAGDDESALRLLCGSGDAFDAWIARWRNDADPRGRLAGMRAADPILIPRNHRVEQAIASAYADDYAPFHRLVDALAAPFDERPEYADLEHPPAPAEVVQQTFCGT